MPTRSSRDAFCSPCYDLERVEQAERLRQGSFIQRVNAEKLPDVRRRYSEDPVPYSYRRRMNEAMVHEETHVTESLAGESEGDAAVQASHGRAKLRSSRVEAAHASASRVHREMLAQSASPSATTSSESDITSSDITSRDANDISFDEADHLEAPLQHRHQSKTSDLYDEWVQVEHEREEQQQQAYRVQQLKEIGLEQLRFDHYVSQQAMFKKHEKDQRILEQLGSSRRYVDHPLGARLPGSRPPNGQGFRLNHPGPRGYDHYNQPINSGEQMYFYGSGFSSDPAFRGFEKGYGW